MYNEGRPIFKILINTISITETYIIFRLYQIGKKIFLNRKKQTEIWKAKQKKASVQSH